MIDTTTKIDTVLTDLRAMLLAKNAAYGDSALKPLRVFSRASAEEQINVRMDDKLSRIARGDGSGNEDAEWDLLGYLVLKRAMMIEDAPAKAETDVPTCKDCLRFSDCQEKNKPPFGRCCFFVPKCEE